jgi:hypothetical protein
MGGHVSIPSDPKNWPPDLRRHVYLASEEIVPLTWRTFLLHRFFIWRLIRKEWIKTKVGRTPDSILEGKVELEDKRPGGIGGTDTIPNVHVLIRRHGPKKAMLEQYPELYEICGKLIAPKNELDQTRIQCWPSNFFVRESVLAGVAEKDEQTAGKPQLVQIPCDRSPSVQIDYVTLKAITKPFAAKPELRWTTSNFEIAICFREGLGRRILHLEHQLTPTHPLKLRFVEFDPKRVMICRLPGQPPWAVAYFFQRVRRPCAVATIC